MDPRDVRLERNDANRIRAPVTAGLAARAAVLPGT